MKTSDVPDTPDGDWQRLGDVAARVVAERLLDRIEKAVGEIEKALAEEDQKHG